MMGLGARPNAAVRTLSRLASLTRIDMLMMALAGVAAIGVAFQLRLETSDFWRRDTVGSSSPFTFRQPLLSTGMTTGNWMFLVRGPKAPEVCEQVSDSRSLRIDVVFIDESDPVPLGCVTEAYASRGWPKVASTMSNAGARTVVLDPEGRVVFSSRDSAYPKAVISTLRIPPQRAEVSGSTQ
jgi:hypothetical protein